MASELPQAALRSVALPKQARSEQTLRRLLDAAEELIQAKGLAGVSIPDIVRRAGSSVGGFYARFRDKNELLRALEERFFVELYGRLDALARPGRWRGAPLEAVVGACVEELVCTVRERESLIRSFQIRAAQDPDVFEDGLRFRRRVSERILPLLLDYRDAIAHPDPALAIDFGVHLAFGLMQQAVLFGDLRVGGRLLSDAEVVEELTRNFLAYLGVRTPSGAAPPETRRRS